MRPLDLGSSPGLGPPLGYPRFGECVGLETTLSLIHPMPGMNKAGLVCDQYHNQLGGYIESGHPVLATSWHGALR